MAISKWLDLTHKVGLKTPVYPGDPELKIEFVRTIDLDTYSLSRVETNMHLGTHVDSPAHFVKGGKTVADIPVGQWMGYQTTLHVLPTNGVLKTADIRSLWDSTDPKHDVLLLNTGHFRRFKTAGFYTDCPAFEPDFIGFLQENRIRLLGLDLPTVKYPGDDHLHAHLDLLGNGILIVESLNNLDEVDSGMFFMALPINLEDVEASPVRAVAGSIG